MPDAITPQEYCRQVCKKSGSNFVYSFYFLGREKRRGMEAFYAFCRLLDDAVDQAPDEDRALKSLNFWREETVRLFQGNPKHPVTQALAKPVKTFSIPREYLEEILLGVETDLNKKSYATFEELETYCYRVASCVGLVSLHIFGLPIDSKTKGAAKALGKALQITNIIRDIASDQKRGRIYIPREDLEKFDVAEESLQKGGDPLNCLELLYFEIRKARQFFKTAWENFPSSNRARFKLLPATLMGRFYEALLDKISKDPLAVFSRKVSLSGMEKTRITLREIAHLIL